MSSTRFPPRPVSHLVPLITAAEAYPALERLVLHAERSVWLAYRVFDPQTRLHAKDTTGTTWKDLLRQKLEQGVSVRVLLSDFDPIASSQLHEGTWRCAEILGDLKSAGDIEVLPVRHTARVGKGARLGLWLMAAREIEMQRRDLNEAGPQSGAAIFACRPGIWRYLRQDSRGRFRWRSLLLPRLFPATLHHKVAVADESRAIIGGLDVDDRRFDDPTHDRPAEETWHDASVEVDGPIASDIARYVAETWNDNRMAMAALRREQSRHAPKGIVVETGAVPPLDPGPASPEHAVNGGIQLIRTASTHRRRLGFQISPESRLKEIEDAHLDLFAGAKRRIYLETQFLRSKVIAEGLATAGRANPSLDLILILPAAPEEVAFENTRHFMHRFGEQLQVDCLDMIREAFGSRAVVLSPVRPQPHHSANRDTLSGAEIIYVHSKIAIADDTEAIVGSANLNGRSMRWDTEAAVRITEAAAVRTICIRAFSAWSRGDNNLDLTAADGATWRSNALANASVPPSHRRSFLVPYQFEPARCFGQGNALLPDELV